MRFLLRYDPERYPLGPGFWITTPEDLASLLEELDWARTAEEADLEGHKLEVYYPDPLYVHYSVPPGCTPRSIEVFRHNVSMLYDFRRISRDRETRSFQNTDQIAMQLAAEYFREAEARALDLLTQHEARDEDDDESPRARRL